MPKFRFISILLTIVILVAACGVSPTPTPPLHADPTPTSTTVLPPTPTPTVKPTPSWLADLITRFEAADPASPPIKISEYLYNSATVYFVPQRCCDIFSDLYSEDGIIIAHPDGGITGMGDGRALDFFTAAKLMRVVWEDPRGQRELVRAPIESLEIVISERFPVQYRAQIVSGLPNGCSRFDHWTVEFDDTSGLFMIEIINSEHTATAQAGCAMVYGTTAHSIPLDDIASDQPYKVQVHDKTDSFIGQ